MLLNACRLVNDEHGIIEVIKRARVRLGDERDQPLPAGERLALVGVNRPVFQRPRVRLVRPAVARELRPQTEVVARHRQLAHRDDLGLFQLFDGELCFGVEAADGVNRVAEELDADGRALARRPNVEDAAAHRELADRAHGVFAHVARRQQNFQQVLRRESLVTSEHRPHLDERARLNRPAHERARRQQHEAPAPARELPERERAPLQSLGVRRRARVRVALGRGQAQHGLTHAAHAAERAAPEGEVALPRLHVAVRGDHHCEATPGLALQSRERQRARRRRSQPRHRHDTRARSDLRRQPPELGAFRHAPQHALQDRS